MMKFIYFLIILLFTVLISCSDETYVEGLVVEEITQPDPDPDPNPGQTTFITNRKFKNYWRNTFISLDGSIVSLNAQGYQWRIEKINATDNFLIINGSAQTSSKYLSFSNGTFSMVNNISLMSSWKFEEVNTGDPSLIRIKHVATGGYLNTEASPSLACGSILSGWLSAMWTN